MAEPTAIEKALKDAGLDAASVAKAAAAVSPIMMAADTMMAAETKKAADALAALEAEKKKTQDAAPPDGAPVAKEDGSYDYSKVAKELVPVWKAKHESDARAARVEKQLAEERDVRVTKEFVEKAAGFKNLGVKTEDLGKVLKDLSEKAPETFKLFEPILKGLDEKIAKGGLFGEIGTTGGAGGGAAPKPGQTDAEAKIDSIAKGLVEKSDGKLTREAAVGKAWAQNPGLYNEHRAETEARKRRA